ncbi:hypothetical protein H1P_1530015 [Hyella patelloides LEGE 07179]|uniref:Uncharacterized protein n=1 Tax=Hyella patelloides LEGE 07179 TaxID=945734 RepID=A0A563VMJ6_9CYAN|nr:hypothetical protein H1P_1530015 [Hyella patelloides LEGE 07179]
MQSNTIAINQLANIANTKNCNSEINQSCIKEMPINREQP